MAGARYKSGDQGARCVPRTGESKDGLGDTAEGAWNPAGVCAPGGELELEVGGEKLGELVDGATVQWHVEQGQHLGARGGGRAGVGCSGGGVGVATEKWQACGERVGSRRSAGRNLEMGGGRGGA